MPDTERNQEEFPHLFNKHPDNVTNAEATKFIKRIYEEHQAGYGFIPLIGAGFSASAGIPTISQLKTYLDRCICWALGADEDGDKGPGRIWNPRSDRWPPLVDPDQKQPTVWQESVYLKYDEYRKINKDQSDKEHQPSNPELEQLFQEAFGAMAEWRSSLAFLSRLTVQRGGSIADKGRAVFELGPQKPEIIDACFREVMKDKRPSLNHTMLAVLSTLLRIDLVLTTNFDNLLEQAFNATGDPLQVFEVHLGDRLPGWAAVSRVRALIKLHGGLHSLRADYTLDDAPSQSDIETFLEYLKGGKTKATRNHLLISGISATEGRTRALIKNAFIKQRDLKVFWVCYSSKDVKQVEAFAKDCEEGCTEKCEGKSARFHILRHTELGLLLLQLDQTIRKTLPPIGAVIPSTTRISLPPMPSQRWVEGKDETCGRLKKRKARDFIKGIKEQLDSFSLDSSPAEKKQKVQYRLVLATSARDVNGVTSACAEVFREKERDYHCLWIEMNDIDSTRNLFEVLLEAAYLKLGREDWTPVYMTDDREARVREIRDLVASTDKPWIIFINCRETAGANRIKGRIEENQPNGWPDRNSEAADGDLPRGDHTNWSMPFIELLQDLSGIQDLGGKTVARMSVVLLCRDSGSHLVKELRAKSGVDLTWELHGLPEGSNCGGSDDVSTEVVKWAAGAADQGTVLKRFIQTLVLMQRPRLLATIWDECVNVPGRRAASEEDKKDWLDELERLGLIRWNDGGVIWMHTFHRNRVRECLSYGGHCEIKLPPEANGTLSNWSGLELDAEIHQRIAHWYIKILNATGSPSAVFEAVDHMCRAAESILSKRFNPGSTDKGKANDLAEEAYSCILTARAVLRSNSFLIQTRGYSVNSCRRLTLIRDMLGDAALIECLDGLTGSIDSAGKHVDDGSKGKIRGQFAKLIIELQIDAVGLMRGIAREVDEDELAYEYHRELSARLIALRSGKILGAGREWEKDKKQYGAGPLALALNTSNTSDSLSKRLGEWTRWFRWCATLAINSRSFEEAENSLGRAVAAFRSGKVEFSKEAPPLPRGLDNESFDEAAKRAEGPLKLEVLRIWEKHISLCLHRHSARARLESIGQASEGRNNLPRYPIADLAKLAASGLELADQLHGADYPSDGKDVASQARWFKAQLLLHYSVICLLLDPGDNEIPKPMGLLDDAQACLSGSESLRNRVAQAYVELHRAEIRLRQAHDHNRRTKDGVRFGDWCLSLLRDTPKSGSEEKHWKKSVKRQFDRNGKTHRVVAMRAADAIRFLDRAEPILRERRRNVWWTTWYFERRLRAIAYTAWANVNTFESPFPFLGFEAAMSRTETEADALLKNALRMIRTDTYRLASVILSYSLCVRALQVHVALDKDKSCSRLYAHRIGLMNSNLEDALKQLSQFEERRKKTAKRLSDQLQKEQEGKGDDRDPEVVGFIKCVGKQSEKLRESVNRWLRRILSD